MDSGLLARTYPRLFHLAESGSWPSIQQFGLLSTTALLDLFGVHGEERQAIEAQQRPESVVLHHPLKGTAVIRDQNPLSEAKLLTCLEGMSPPEWYRLLNGKVYFWLTEARVRTLLSARAYRARPHLVLIFDTQRLIERYEPRMWLSPINSGAALYQPPKRGQDTFRRIADYPFEEWRKKRKATGDAIVELAVDRGIEDVGELILSVEEWENPQRVRELFTSRVME